ncbi:MAG: response regulator [bacterium]|nr:response regulator [bacterium]
MDTGKHVLICEDDSGILDVVSIVLESKGYFVTAMAESTNIISIIKDTCPDIILLDLWIAGKQGDEITRELKSSADTKDIPIIIFSANKDTAMIAQRAGADAFLAKPFEILDLENMVEKYIS